MYKMAVVRAWPFFGCRLQGHWTEERLRRRPMSWLARLPQQHSSKCNLARPRLLFDHAATLCLTGADMQWQIDRAELPVIARWTSRLVAFCRVSQPCMAVRLHRLGRSTLKPRVAFGSTACYALGELGGNAGTTHCVRRRFSDHDKSYSSQMPRPIGVPVAPTTPIIIDTLGSSEYDRLLPSRRCARKVSFRLLPTAIAWRRRRISWSTACCARRLAGQ